MVEPDPDAVALADEMIGSDEIMRTILSETIEATNGGDPRESGRTYCEAWGSILPPTRSGPTSIDLQTCVSGDVGVWHTHPGYDGLTEPINSLPDMANAVFGHVDASVVPGVKTADVVVAPADREKAVAEFQRAVGADVRSAVEVRQAIEDGRIDPVRARGRARKILSGLIRTEKTGYRDLTDGAEIPGPGDAISGSQAVCACSTHEEMAPPTYPSECIQEADAEFDLAAASVAQRIDNLEIGSIAISAAVGNVVGEMVNRVLFE